MPKNNSSSASDVQYPTGRNNLSKGSRNQRVPRRFGQTRKIIPTSASVLSIPSARADWIGNEAFGDHKIDFFILSGARQVFAIATTLTGLCSVTGDPPLTASTGRRVATRFRAQFCHSGLARCSYGLRTAPLARRRRSSVPYWTLRKLTKRRFSRSHHFPNMGSNLATRLLRHPPSGDGSNAQIKCLRSPLQSG